MSTAAKPTVQYLDNASHDWLGEAAENYIRYIFAREKLPVYAGDKWGADCAVYDQESKSLLRIEVKSTDRQRRPAWNSEQVRSKADIVAEVRFHNAKQNEGSHTLDVVFIWTKEGRGGTQYRLVSVCKDGEVNFKVQGDEGSVDLGKFLWPTQKFGTRKDS
jgi:hypothetical protein